MPYGNGMGPEGNGPGTGRRMGYCAGYDRPGCYNKGRGMGAGRGFGAGRGMNRGGGFSGSGRGFGRSGFSAAGRFFGGFYQGNNVNEIDFLKEQQEDLELELAAVKERIKTIDEKESEK